MTTGTVLLFAMTLCFVSPAQAQETNPLVLTQTIAFPNVQGGFNHMSVDADRQRLFEKSRKGVEASELVARIGGEHGGAQKNFELRVGLFLAGGFCGQS